MCSTTQTAAILGRWQPVHLGHQAALLALCTRYDRVVIGLGSANVRDYRNPFSHHEVCRMLELALEGVLNYELLPVPDLPDDDDWCRQAIELFGRPDRFFTANPYVTHLLGAALPIAHPVSVIPVERRIAVSATQVRRGLARGAGWTEWLPPAVAEFILANGLDVRFREQFGLQTLAVETLVVN